MNVASISLRRIRLSRTNSFADEPLKGIDEARPVRIRVPALVSFVELWAQNCYKEVTVNQEISMSVRSRAHSRVLSQARRRATWFKPDKVGEGEEKADSRQKPPVPSTERET